MRGDPARAKAAIMDKAPHVEREVSLCRTLEALGLVFLYGLPLLPFLRLWRDMPFPGGVIPQLLVAPMIQGVGLLIAAVIVHQIARRFIAGRFRLFVWRGSLKRLEQNVASHLFSRSSSLHSWVRQKPGAVGVEQNRIILCDAVTRYENLRLSRGDILRLVVMPESNPPLLHFAWRSGNPWQSSQTSMTFRDAEQALCWFDRLHTFLSTDGEARRGKH